MLGLDEGLGEVIHIHIHTYIHSAQFCIWNVDVDEITLRGLDFFLLEMK